MYVVGTQTREVLFQINSHHHIKCVKIISTYPTEKNIKKAYTACKRVWLHSLFYMKEPRTCLQFAECIICPQSYSDSGNLT